MTYSYLFIYTLVGHFLHCKSNLPSSYYETDYAYIFISHVSFVYIQISKRIKSSSILKIEKRAEKF